MYEDLSSKQLEILKYMKQEISSKGYPPSVREMCQAVGLRSTSTVHGHLNKLEEKGYIRRDPTKPRAIEILSGDDHYDVKLHKEIIHVPILGKVTAGEPILAVENIEETFPLPIDFLSNSNEDVFILSIKGESMIETGILDGDYVIVRKQSHAANGDIVVALLENEATVKRFYHEGDHVRLQPENKYMEPIIVKDVAILGKVIGVFRKM
ncbi:transcriptional repressor LexA [Clostridium formicaceticum]|uniref:LexA repressor n=1 Tax=Clostridium formicaceticum TaxID=1497 RepID=A0AAC9RL49_9CLOT|nr:transcriptional repressor LexA [Clostridium formicaceticum]AOY77165.1 repressor LexA [Clostridium formicaceticum]ARE87684.1 LexA repressor [Clostridium formicaceticum]